MSNRFFGFLFILLLLVCVNPIEAEDISFQLDTVYYMEFTVEVPRVLQFGSGRLIPDKPDLFIIRDSSGFDIYELSNGRSQYLRKITFQQIPSNYDSPPLWTVGDLNNNGLDEIITWVDSSVITFEWDGKEFVKQIFGFPRKVDQVVIGDIDNDSLNEASVLYYGKKWEPSQPRFSYLCIAKPDKSQLKVIWTDNGVFGFIHSYAVPPDKLVCIGDITNIGKNQVMVMGSQSDMSPSRYDLLLWNNSELVRISSPLDSNQSIPTTDSYFIGPFFLPIKLASKTMVFGVRVSTHRVSAHSGTMALDHILFNIENDSLMFSAKLPEYGPVLIFPPQILWIDPDGKGKGVLRIEIKDLHKIELKFYRMRES